MTRRPWSRGSATTRSALTARPPASSSRPAAKRHRPRIGDERDVVLGEQQLRPPRGRSRRAGRAAAGSGVTSVSSTSAICRSSRCGGGEQSELVERQRPARRRRAREHEPAALLRPPARRAAPGSARCPMGPGRSTRRRAQESPSCRTRRRARRTRARPPGSCARRGDRARRRSSAPGVNDAPAAPATAGELEVVRVRAAERLGDRQRPVPEVVVRGEQLHVDEITGEIVHCQHRLEPGDAAARDQDAEAADAARDEKPWPISARVSRPPVALASGRNLMPRRESRSRVAYTASTRSTRGSDGHEQRSARLQRLDVGDERVEPRRRDDPAPVRHADDRRLAEHAARHDDVADLRVRVELA